jgi:uncharacterized membrane protein YidH (DUF202 family)
VPTKDATPTKEPDPRLEPSIGGMVELVKQYAKQETVGPIRGAGRWAAYGAGGAVLIGLATGMLVLGVLRLLQTETSIFEGHWMSLVPYFVAVVVAVLVIVIAVSRIGKKTLEKES